MLFDILLRVRKVNFLIANSNAFTCIITKSTVFTCKDSTSQRKKVGGNVTTHAQHRIIYFCIIYESS